MIRLAARSTSRLAALYFAVSLTVTVATASQASRAPGGGSTTPVAPPLAANGVPFVIQAPVLDAHASSISGDSIVIAGSARDAFRVEVSGPGGVLNVPVANERFTATLPVGSVLGANRVNPLYFTAIAPTFDRQRSAPATSYVTHDLVPPSLFIDFPAPGAEITTDTVDVMGRVGDLLSGYAGLTVLVNGQPAQVSVGTGNNGTFVRLAVPLALGRNAIDVLASDALGNTQPRSIQVTRIQIPAGNPRMEIVSGNGQSAIVGSELAQPLRVRVLRSDGMPFAGKVVSFHVTRNDGRMAGTQGAADASMLYQTLADADGYAEAWWRVGGTAGQGNNRVEVLSTDILGSTFFCASGTPGVADQINIGSGNNQRAEVGTLAPQPLRVWVSDSCNPVAGIPVTFTVLQGGGLLNGATQATVPTGTTGHAEIALQLGTTPGPNVVEANFAGNPTTRAVFTVYGISRDLDASTRFSGIVFDNAMQPIGGALCTLAMPGQAPLETVSNEQGQFRFTDIPSSGSADLFVDGATATLLNGQMIPVGSFPPLHYEPVLVANAENGLGMPVLLPRLNPNNRKLYSTSEPTELTCEGMDGLRMIIAPGSMRIPGTYGGHALVPAPDGTPVSLNQVHHDDVPMPMPDGAAPPFAWTVQPAGAHFDPPIRIEYPNMSALPPGALANFLSFDHDTGKFEIVSSAQVCEDGSTIVSDYGQGLSISGWGCNCPPYSVTEDCDDECPLDGCSSAPRVVGGGQSGCDCRSLVTCECSDEALERAEFWYQTVLEYAVFVDIATATLPPFCTSHAFGRSMVRWREGSGDPLVWDTEECMSYWVGRDAEFVTWICRTREFICERLVDHLSSNPAATSFTASFRLSDIGIVREIVLDRTSELKHAINSIQPSNVTVAATVQINPDARTYEASLSFIIADYFSFACGDLVDGSYFDLPGLEGAMLYLQNCGGAAPFFQYIHHSHSYTGTIPLVPNVCSISADSGVCPGSAPGALVADEREPDLPPTIVTLQVGGQAAELNLWSGIRIRNVSAADNWGAGGPGTAPDLQSDDPIRGVITFEGSPRFYAYTTPFYLSRLARNAFPAWHFAPQPPPAIESLCVRLSPGSCADPEGDGVVRTGDQLQLVVVATTSAGDEVDVSASQAWTTYRSSNPLIAAVDGDGRVSARSPGIAFITALNDGIAGSRRVQVTAQSAATTVQGVVQTPEGGPAGGAHVWVAPGFSTVADRSGNFSVDVVVDVPPGMTRVLATSLAGQDPPSYLTAPQTVVADGRTDVGILVLRDQLCDVPYGNPVYAVGQAPYGVEVADISGDGLADIVSTNLEVDSMSRLRNLGNSRFERLPDLSAGNGPRGLAIRDMDGDGDLDVVITSSVDNAVRLMRNDGSGSLSVAAIVPVGQLPTSCVIADIDNDGDLDVAVTNAQSNTVTLIDNLGTWAFSTRTLTAVGQGPYDLELGDVDSDGLADLTVVGLQDSMLRVLRQSAAGTFEQVAAVGLLVRPRDVEQADLDGDGRLDCIVVGERTGGTLPELVTVIVNDQAGFPGAISTYALPMSVPGAALFPNRSRAVDADQDGDKDLLVATVNSRAILVLQNENGALSYCSQSGTLGPNYSFGVGRLDSDARDDLATGNYETEGTVSILLAGVACQFGVGVPVDGLVGPIAAGDVDGDGDTDVVGRAVFLNQGDGSITKVQAGAVPSYGTSVELADLDADGDLDAIDVSGGGAVRTVENDGSGTFAERSVVAITNPRGIAVGGLTGDQRLDIAVTQFSANTVAVFRGGPDLSLTLVATVPVGLRPVAVTTIDIDGDGVLDLAIANQNSNNVTLVANTDNGTTWTPLGSVTLPGCGFNCRPSSVASADVDGDVDADLVVGVPSGVFVLTNLGGGNFLVSRLIATSGSGRVSCVDTDGDGDADVVVGGGGIVSVLRNDGRGAWNPSPAMGGGPFSFDAFTMCDLDSSGALDLVLSGFDTVGLDRVGAIALGMCK